jgi:hypothetical protein
VKKPAKKPVTEPAAKKPASKFTAEQKDELSLIFIFCCY